MTYLFCRHIGGTHIPYTDIFAIPFLKQTHVIPGINIRIIRIDNLIIANFNHQIPVI